MWELLLVLLLISGGLYKGWVSWRTILILFVVYIIIGILWMVYLYRKTNFSRTKYITSGNTVYKLEKVSQDPYFFADDGGSDYVVLAGTVLGITDGSDRESTYDGSGRGIIGGVIVRWNYITQPRVGNKYLPLGTYTGKDFTWNLSTFPYNNRALYNSSNHPLAKLSRSNGEILPDDEVSTTYPQ